VAGGLGDLASGAGDLASGGLDLGGDLLSGAGDLLSGAPGVLMAGAQGAGALLDGLLLGDIHGSGYENPWLESARALGHAISGFVVVGDIRDSLFNLGKVVVTGGQEGKADLGLSLFGIVPYFGDVAKGGKLADGVADAFRAADTARDGERAADGARAAKPPPARPRPGCPRSSFTADTPVLMAGGRSQAIADVDVGERVIATDPATGETAARTVERVIHSEGQKTLVRVRISGEVLTATDRHPFWVESQGAYRKAADLRPGDVLREPDGERAAVESVRVLEPEPERVHNLTVAGLHTYYAGKAPVLVHNAGYAFAPGTGRSALTDRRIQHGTDHLQKEGVLPRWSKSTSPELYRQKLAPILERPTGSFDDSLGETRTKVFTGQIDGHEVAIHVYKDGQYAGEIATAVVPKGYQRVKWGFDAGQ